MKGTGLPCEHHGFAGAPRIRHGVPKSCQDRRMRDAVTVHMKATPEDIWALVSDITRIGEFSPETF
ncbi:MAG: hypothetical protein QOD70_1969, partial [Frankiales bacterium]|nr:hypothetical protein [Frankiales bacterium]